MDLATALTRWRRPGDGIVLFAREAIQGISRLDPLQIKLLRDFQDPLKPRVASVAATGTGKTFCESICIWWFASVLGGKKSEDHPKGLVTAIDGKNMDMNLWPELSKRYESSPFLQKYFVLQSDKLFSREFPKSWFVEKRTWDARSSTAVGGGNAGNALGLAGHHAKFSLFLVDESSGVPSAVIEAGERTLSTHGTFKGGLVKVFQAGNPTQSSGPLYDAATKNKHLWNGGDGPVFMTGDPDDPQRSPNVPIGWAREQIATYGRDYPFVQVYILAQFPTASFNAFIGASEIEEAQNRDYAPHVYIDIASVAGLDVSYEGDDKSIYTPRQGLKMFDPTELKIALSDPHIGRNMAYQVHDLMLKPPMMEDLNVDTTGGYAQAVMENLRLIGRSPLGIKFNEKATMPGFKNIRTQMLFKFAQWVRGGGALPKESAFPKKGFLAEEGAATMYTIVNGVMVAEPKVFVKKRIGRSPDYWDSGMLTFARPEKPSRNPMSKGVGTVMQSVLDTNPIAEYYRKRNEPRGPRDFMGRNL